MDELELINQFTRRQVTADEVYIFPLTLCDNEIDRDSERFSVKTLEGLSELFVGKTGIFDHDPSGKNQTARIFSCEVVRDENRMTKAGEVYTSLKARAYMMRTEKNADLIKELDGGIKKEVSVCCRVAKDICSICGADRKTSPCTHVKGSYYGGELCTGILDEAQDAYEWSFVAVPAQPAAGVTKSLGASDESAAVKALKADLDNANTELAKARADIINDIIRLGQLCVPAYEQSAVKTMCEGMDISTLAALREKTRASAKTCVSKGIFDGRQETEIKNENQRFKLAK